MKEIAVVGGGPAGSAAAALLARRGRDVVLFERDAFPRPKLCGEFLSYEGQGLLDRIGCLPAVLDVGPAKIERARFTAPSGAAIVIELPSPALGITRRALDAILFENARRVGAEAIERAEVRSIRRTDRFHLEVMRDRDRLESFESEAVIAAYGRRTRLDVEMRRGFTGARHRFVAFERHHRPSASLICDLGGAVEIHTVDGGYCGMSFVETGEVNVCMLLEQRFVDRLESASWDEIVRALSRSNAALGARLAELSPSDEDVQAVAEIPFGRKESARNGILFLGDAAGMIAPLAGDGQAMALESALILSKMLERLPRSPTPSDVDRVGRRWSLEWRMRFEPRMHIGAMLQRLLFVPHRADRVIRSVRGIPGLGGLLARWTRGSGTL